MANALIFAVVLAILVPVFGTLFQVVRGLFAGISAITGFGVMIDLMEVLDACLPFSFIQFMSLFALVAGSLATFLTARKIANMLTGLFTT